MRHRLAALLIVLLVALVAPPAAAATPDRVFGPSRLETAVAISQRAFPDGSESVYLARADVLADALAAGSLRDGPVLLVPSCGDVPEAVATEVERLQPGEVVALGGERAVCDATLRELGAGAETDRLAGEGRTGTAIAISLRAFPESATTVYLADAEESPDAVAGGSLVDGPILLVPSSGEPGAAVREEIERLDPERVVALGGAAAVADETRDQAADGREVDRISGQSRIETAIAIARVSFPETADVVYLARADIFADAVAAGSLVDGPVLLVPSCGRVPTSVLAALERLAPDDVIALGGTAAVCDGLLQSAARGGDGLGELLFTRTSTDQEFTTGTIWTMAADGSGAAQLSPDPAAGDSQGGTTWSGDGRYVSYIDLLGDRFEMNLIDTLDPELRPVRAFDANRAFGHLCSSGLGYGWNPRTSSFLVACNRSEEPDSYALIGVDGSVRALPLDASASVGDFAFSPDGRTLVLVEERSTADGVARRTLTADLTSETIALVELPLPASSLVYVPDGSELLYGPPGSSEIRAAQPDGTGDRAVATAAAGESIRVVDFDGDGGAILRVSEELAPDTSKVGVDRLNLATGTREVLVRGDGRESYAPNETSPDGDRLSTTHYEVDDSGEVIASSAAIIDLETGAITELPTTSLDFSFPWRPSA